VNQV
jgi:hypothetical protein